MKFKEQRQQDDFAQLASQNMKLKRILVCVDNFSVCEFGKEIMVTSIHRTEEENKAAGAATDIHVYWKAADISVKQYSADELIEILNFLNMFSYPGTPGHKTALVHSVPGGAVHCHIQYW